jgi:hypothetical protein
MMCRAVRRFVRMEELTESQGRVRHLVPRPVALAVAGAVLLAALGSRPVEKKSSPRNSAANLGHMLVGVFRGSSPGNDLTIVSAPLGATPTSQLEKLQVRVTGTYKGDAVLLRGLWRISYQGDAVWLVFIPGVDPTEAGRRFSDPTFVPTELEAGCWTVLRSGDGAFEGTVKPFPNCRNALGAGEVQSVGKEWSARFSAEEMRFENRETDETLSFARAAAK